jgi:hypothetical protein
MAMTTHGHLVHDVTPALDIAFRLPGDLLLRKGGRRLIPEQRLATGSNGQSDSYDDREEGEFSHDGSLGGRNSDSSKYLVAVELAAMQDSFAKSHTNQQIINRSELLIGTYANSNDATAQPQFGDRSTYVRI